MKYFPLIFLVIAFFSCGKKMQVVPSYIVSKVFRSDSVTLVDIHISDRLPVGELLLIAGKLKSDSLKLQNLVVHFLLPGNTDLSAGDNSYYASARYVKESFVKSTDTLKDDAGNVFRIMVFGLNQQKSRHLLALQPKEIAGKNVMGRFIDDYNHTVIIPFTDGTDKTGKLYIIELDSAATVVSATMPLKVNDAGVAKWLVTQNGDYITIKDSVLTQYAGDGLGVPFNSIKSGI